MINSTKHELPALYEAIGASPLGVPCPTLPPLLAATSGVPPPESQHQHYQQQQLHQQQQQCLPSAKAGGAQADPFSHFPLPPSAAAQPAVPHRTLSLLAGAVELDRTREGKRESSSRRPFPRRTRGTAPALSLQEAPLRAQTLKRSAQHALSLQLSPVQTPRHATLTPLSHAAHTPTESPRDSGCTVGVPEPASPSQQAPTLSGQLLGPSAATSPFRGGSLGLAEHASLESLRLSHIGSLLAQQQQQQHRQQQTGLGLLPWFSGSVGDDKAPGLPAAHQPAGSAAEHREQAHCQQQGRKRVRGNMETSAREGRSPGGGGFAVHRHRRQEQEQGSVTLGGGGPQWTSLGTPNAHQRAMEGLEGTATSSSGMGMGVGTGTLSELLNIAPQSPWSEAANHSQPKSPESLSLLSPPRLCFTPPRAPGALLAYPPANREGDGRTGGLAATWDQQQRSLVLSDEPAATEAARGETSGARMGGRAAVQARKVAMELERESRHGEGSLGKRSSWPRLFGVPLIPQSSVQ